MSKFNLINRIGSEPKIICYSQSNKERKYWEDQKKPNEIISYELDGKGKKRFISPPSGEIKKFRSKHLFPQPNTKRTINPFLAPEDKYFQKSKSSNNLNIYNYNNKNNNNNNNNSNYYKYATLTNFKLFPSKKRSSNFRLYRNNFSIDNNDLRKNLNINYNYDFYEDPYSKKRQLKNGLFTHYKTTTQIVNLPGGIKRNQNDINDDKSMMEIKPKIKLIHPSFSLKVEGDFKSNVSCLPNSMTKNYNDKNKINNYYYNDKNKFNGYYNNEKNTINNYYYNDNWNKRNKNYFNNSYLKEKKIDRINHNKSEFQSDGYSQNLNKGRKSYYKNYSQFSLG